MFTAHVSAYFIFPRLNFLDLIVHVDLLEDRLHMFSVQMFLWHYWNLQSFIAAVNGGSIHQVSFSVIDGRGLMEGSIRLVLLCVHGRRLLTDS